MKAYKAFGLLLIIGITINVFPQHILKTKNYTSQKKISSGIVFNLGFWGAGEGGAFFFNIKDSSYKVFTKTEGLNGSPITSLSLDNEGKIWFGSSNGIIDVYNPANNSFKRIVDIYNSGRASKSINSIIIKGDTAVVSTDFGISLINCSSLSFFDTYFKFGSFSSNVKVNSAVFTKNLFYVATSSGVAIQKPGTINLIAPESWNVYSTSNGLPDNNIIKIANYRDTIVCASGSGLSFFNGSQWFAIDNFFSGKYIKDIFIKNDSLFILANFTLNNSVINSLYLYRNGVTKLIFTSNQYPGKIISIDNKIYLATELGLEVIDQNFNSNSFYPNGPSYNIFFNLSVNPLGNLWVSTGDDHVLKGAFRFDMNNWKEFNLNAISSNVVNAVYYAYTPDKNTYLATWGTGFVKINDKDQLIHYGAYNTPLVGIKINPAFIVITSLKKDSQGNLWILNYEASNRKTLSVLTSDSTWYGFDNLTDPSVAPTQYRMLMIDQYDTKWFVSTSGDRPGLHYFNENSSSGKKTFTVFTDDKYGYLNSSNGLNTNYVNALALDKRGDIWVGTSLGVNVISNTNTVLNSTPQLRISSLFSLRQQSINCIAVDAIDQKWVGTNQGLLVVTSDGRELVAAFDSKNSPLVSDIIRSIAIDEERGIVYVGCEGGLTAFHTSILSPKESFDKLSVYPSPFIIDETNTNLTVDGLVKDSELKIFSISGELVNHIVTPGGRIGYWNGTDINGNKVNSGIYLIIAYDKDGNNIAKEKIAVIRK